MAFHTVRSRRGSLLMTNQLTWKMLVQCHPYLWRERILVVDMLSHPKNSLVKWLAFEMNYVSVYICIFLIHVSSRITCSKLCSQVGAKSRNIAYLKGKVASWIGIPTSVAIPFGVFEHVLSDKSNQVLYIIFLSIFFRLLNERLHLLFCGYRGFSMYIN